MHSTLVAKHQTCSQSCNLPQLNLSPCDRQHLENGEIFGCTFAACIYFIIYLCIYLLFTYLSINSLIPGTAADGTDYTGAGTFPVSFDLNSPTTTIDITITDDDLIEGDKTLTLTLSNPNTGSVDAAKSVLTVTITEDGK